MTIRRLSASGRFQKRIFIWITFTFIVLLFLFSIFSYINMEYIVMNNVYETNIDILSQVKYNVQLMDNTIKNFCKELFINPDVAELMYGDDSDTFQSLAKMKNIELVLISNPFVESVYIYNGKSGTFYSPGKSITTEKDFFAGIAGKGKLIPILKPLVLENKIEKNVTGKSKQSLSYFMYQYTDNDNIPNGAVIINIDASWLLNNLEQVNTRRYGSAKIYVFNEEGDFISDREKQNDPSEHIKKLFDDYTTGNLHMDDKKGYLERKIDGKSSIVTFLRIESAGLVLIRTQTYSDAFGLFTAMRIALAVIVFIFLVIAFCASIFVSRVIYKPLGNFIHRLRENKSGLAAKGVEPSDELNYLEGIYEISISRLKEYEDENMSRKDLLKEYHLKKLILDSTAFSSTDMERWFSENNINLGTGGEYLVCVLKIDEYSKFNSSNDSATKVLLKFAIINIATEIISSGSCVEGVDMDDERIVLIVNIKDKDIEEAAAYPNIMRMIRQVQDCVLKHYSISFSASVSRFSRNITELSKLYGSALESLNYRLVFGKRCIICPDSIIQNRQHEFSFDCEKLLTDSIKSGSFEKIEGVLRRILEEIKKFDYKSIILSMLLVVDTIEKNVDDINSVSLKPVDADFLPIKQSIFSIETLDEIFDVLLDQQKVICSEREKNTVSAKHLVITENVKAIIEKEYYDSSLCLSAIAHRLKMSSGYLGKIFKDCCGISVNEYINDVRLTKAAEWLRKSSLTVSEVLLKVGIENETYFYSLFKKRYGVTPKEYVLNRQLQTKH